MNKNIKVIFSIILILILFQSVTNTIIEVFSVENNSEENNWEYINHNVRGTNYSPQNQINAENAHMLELK